MFGHDSLPSKIYSYGAREPIENLDLVEKQIHLAHKYYNCLVAIERDRRTQMEELIRKVAPDLKKLDDEIKNFSEQIEHKQNEIKKTNQRERRRTASQDIRIFITELKKRRKEARQSHKELRTATFTNPSFKKQMEKIDNDIGERSRKARKTSGLYWGNYAIVEQSIQAAKRKGMPNFHRWDGNGHLAVQIQNGMTFDEACAADSRIRLQINGKYAVALFRIGSDKRLPIFVKIPFYFHRPLPDDCRIKWVHLIRRRVGTHYKWQLQFVVSKAEGFDTDAATSGACGVDVGWRLLKNGLRVAYWVGDDGREGELILPIKDLSRWSKVESLRSIRDKMFDAMLSEFVEWCQGRTLPEWLTEKIKGTPEKPTNLISWKSPARLAAVVILWRNNRFIDDSIFEKLELWRKDDKHLYDWECYNMRKAVNWRDGVFEKFAKELRTKYQTIGIEDTNWALMKLLPNPEDTLQYGSREYQTIASVGRLLEILKEKASRVVKVDASYTTQRCHVCDKLDPFDAATNLVRTCEHCGTTEDQDKRAACNILKVARGPVVAEIPGTTR